MKFDMQCPQCGHGRILYAEITTSPVRSDGLVDLYESSSLDEWLQCEDCRARFTFSAEKRYPHDVVVSIKKYIGTREES